MAKIAEVNASGLAPVTVPVPRFQPAEPAVLARKRAAARKALTTLQPPSDKKYTNWLRRGIAERFEGMSIGGKKPTLSADHNDVTIGSLKKLPAKLQSKLLGEALGPDAHYFSALSGSLYSDGAFIVVPANTNADIAIEYSADSGKLNAYRTVVVIGKGAEVSISERQTGAAGKPTIVAQGTEVYLDQEARLAYQVLQAWPKSVTHLAAYRSHQQRDSNLDWLVGSFGANFSQVHVESGLAGEGAESNIHGTFFGSSDQHFEQQLVANHLVGKTTSDTYARGIVTDQAKAVYRGMIKIQRGAHGSSADQNGHAMLLSDEAHVDAIPGLEIDADDVVAGHGATVGQIDEEQLFYLMSRGLSREQATDLIIRGFFEDLFKRIKQEETRASFWRSVEAKLT